jgi:hypothetical protein
MQNDPCSRRGFLRQWSVLGGGFILGAGYAHSAGAPGRGESLVLQKERDGRFQSPVAVFPSLLVVPSDALVQSIGSVGFPTAGGDGIFARDAASSIRGTVGVDGLDILMSALSPVQGVTLNVIPRVEVGANGSATIEVADKYTYALDADKKNTRTATVGLRLEIRAVSLGEAVELVLKGSLRQFETTVRTGALEQPVFSERVLDTAVRVQLGESFVCGLGRRSNAAKASEWLLVLKVCAV